LCTRSVSFRGVAKLIDGEEYSPATVNGWIGILFTVLRAARREFDLGHDATNGVSLFDLSEHETYTELDRGCQL
jgi:hypothetical protein